MLKNSFTYNSRLSVEANFAKSSHLIALGFDFGLKRIGVAIGQTLTQSANPVTILKAENGIPDWEKIKKIIKIWKVNILVIGVPYNMNSSKQQPITYAALKFSNKLKLKSGLPYYTVDERLTTVEAKRLWWFDQKFQKNVKLPQQFDSYAAKIILEQWFQENADQIR
ncbi:MAG: Holliday junction resolvase RuvX [Coxiella endosymbiont of Dermacentor silvarum]